MARVDALYEAIFACYTDITRLARARSRKAVLLPDGSVEVDANDVIPPILLPDISNEDLEAAVADIAGAQFFPETRKIVFTRAQPRRLECCIATGGIPAHPTE